jgi:hypothetical protein
MLVSGSEALFEDGTRTSRPSSRLPSASKCNATVFSESPASACERSAISDARFGDGEIADYRTAEDARVRRWPPPQKSQKTVKSRPRIDAPPGFRYPRPYSATGGPRAPRPRPGVCVRLGSFSRRCYGIGISVKTVKRLMRRCPAWKRNLQLHLRAHHIAFVSASRAIPPQVRAVSSMRRSSRQPRGGQATTADSLPPHGAPRPRARVFANAPPALFKTRARLTSEFLRT